jgi:hypothetical protein
MCARTLKFLGACCSVGSLPGRKSFVKKAYPQQISNTHKVVIKPVIDRAGAASALDELNEGTLTCKSEDRITEHLEKERRQSTQVRSSNLFLS